jgi:UDP-GlcNAc3NAcA epimerase
LRPQTEWIEIVENGNAELVGADYSKIVTGGKRLLGREDYTYPSLYGDGKAAEFIGTKILETLS